MYVYEKWRQFIGAKNVCPDTGHHVVHLATTCLYENVYVKRSDDRTLRSMYQMNQNRLKSSEITPLFSYWTANIANAALSTKPKLLDCDRYSNRFIWKVHYSALRMYCYSDLDGGNVIWYYSFHLQDEPITHMVSLPLLSRRTDILTILTK